MAGVDPIPRSARCPDGVGRGNPLHRVAGSFMTPRQQQAEARSELKHAMDETKHVLTRLAEIGDIAEGYGLWAEVVAAIKAVETLDHGFSKIEGELT